LLESVFFRIALPKPLGTRVKLVTSGANTTVDAIYLGVESIKTELALQGLHRKRVNHRFATRTAKLNFSPI
jgi:hypothetical protein